MFFLEFLSSILVGTIEKSVYLNLIKIILKFHFVWINCSRSLKIELMSLFGFEKLFSRSSSQVQEASNLFLY